MFKPIMPKWKWTKNDNITVAFPCHSVNSWYQHTVERTIYHLCNYLAEIVA